MKMLFAKWLSALLVVALLLSPVALMEEIPAEEAPAIESSVEEVPEIEPDTEAIPDVEPAGEDVPEAEPDAETAVAAESADLVVEEAESALDGAASPEALSDDDELDMGTEESEGDTSDAPASAPLMEAAEDGTQVYTWQGEAIVDNDALFNGYVESLFGVNQSLLFAARNIGSELSGTKKALYDFLSECVVEIAAGKRSSTRLTFSGGAGLSYDDIVDVINCLVADHPFDMYWYANGVRFVTSGNSLRLDFYVSSGYASGQFSVNAASVSKATTAASNARAIVKKYASYSDYNKLVAYRDEICNAVTYNYDAASSSWPQSNNDPWQVIWVFDGDSSTNVVCEGYAKAFQYLCDMTSFSSNVICYSVTGYNDGVLHEWNVIRMPNGKNYIADITFCDDDSTGYYDWVFMKAPTSGDMSSGYYFKITNSMGSVSCTYVYDSSCLSTYRASDLVLSSADYLSEVDATAVDTVETPATTTDTTADTTTDTSTGSSTSQSTLRTIKATKNTKAKAYVGYYYQLDLGGKTGKSFKSSDKKVARVTSKGIIVPKAAGKAKITFKVGTKTRTVTLTVKDPTVPKSVKLNLKGTVAAKVGNKVTLTATLSAGAISKLKWTSSDKKIATVSSKGVVTFKKKGTVTITVTTVMGNKTAKVKFKVSK